MFLKLDLAALIWCLKTSSPNFLEVTGFALHAIYNGPSNEKRPKWLSLCNAV